MVVVDGMCPVGVRSSLPASHFLQRKKRVKRL